MAGSLTDLGLQILPDRQELGGPSPKAGTRDTWGPLPLAATRGQPWTLVEPHPGSSAVASYRTCLLEEAPFCWERRQGWGELGAVAVAAGLRVLAVGEAWFSFT